MGCRFYSFGVVRVTPRMRRVSWNDTCDLVVTMQKGHASHEACELKLQSMPLPGKQTVTPRMRRVSWNGGYRGVKHVFAVTPRMRRVSWNENRVAEHNNFARSRLAWGVWVEIVYHSTPSEVLLSRLAWGVWVEIFLFGTSCPLVCCHASHEACELKCFLQFVSPEVQASRLAWGVWVEMFRRKYSMI